MGLKLIHVCMWVINTRRNHDVQRTMARKLFNRRTMIVVALSTGGSFRQPIDTHSNVFENAEQDHVVDASPDKNDGKALVHAGFGDSLGGLANLAGFP
jgi:hypothetical protein